MAVSGSNNSKTLNILIIRQLYYLLNLLNIELTILQQHRSIYLSHSSNSDDANYSTVILIL